MFLLHIFWKKKEIPLMTLNATKAIDFEKRIEKMVMIFCIFCICGSLFQKFLVFLWFLRVFSVEEIAVVRMPKLMDWIFFSSFLLGICACQSLWFFQRLSVPLATDGLKPLPPPKRSVVSRSTVIKNVEHVNYFTFFSFIILTYGFIAAYKA